MKKRSMKNKKKRYVYGVNGFMKDVSRPAIMVACVFIAVALSLTSVVAYYVSIADTTTTDQSPVTEPATSLPNGRVVPPNYTRPPPNVPVTVYNLTG